MKPHLLTLLAALTLPVAAAHTAVTEIKPSAEAVTLRFSEPVNLRYSIFKVYPLPAGQTGTRAAADLTRRMITLRGDEANRADLYRARAGQSSGVTVPLKSNLAAGQYAVMWRLMSADGHPVTGQSVFSVK